MTCYKPGKKNPGKYTVKESNKHDEEKDEILV
jgi:hypothetical protein